MNLEEHMDRLGPVRDELVLALNHMNEVHFERRKSFLGLGVIHPEMVRAEFGACKALGAAAFELVKVVPHIPEMVRLRNEQNNT